MDAQIGNRVWAAAVLARAWPVATRRRGQHALDGRITTVEADDQPELHSFANGIRRDQHAVTSPPA